MRATNSKGVLQPINNCYIIIPNFILGGDKPVNEKVILNNIPDIGDSKTAHYSSDPIMGRSSPIHTYHFSDTRSISVVFHLYVIEPADIQYNLALKRAIESCLYPRGSSLGSSSTFLTKSNPGNNLNSNYSTYRPPPICRFRFGDFLANQEELCLSLQNVQIHAPNDVAYDPDTLCPYKFDISTNWWVVYSSDNLPDQSRILNTGR